MKRIIKTFILVLIFGVFFSGCVQNSYQKFYTPLEGRSNLKENPNIEFLKSGEMPIVYSSNNLDEDIKKYIRKRYVMIGVSSFNGKIEGEEAIIQQAKNIGAKLALYGMQYTNTQTNSGVLMLPQTNYQNTNMYGNVGGTMFSGMATTTTTGTQMVPYSNTVRRFDQTAFYFVKNNSKSKFGVIMDKISREKRIQIDKNGVEIKFILEDTPSYNSNLLEGDIIVSFDNIKVNSLEHLHQLMKEYDTSKGSCVLSVLRNNSEKNITINF